MNNHFHKVEDQNVHGIIVEIYDGPDDINALAQFLQPRIIEIYNQFYRTPENVLDRAGLPRIQRLLTTTLPTTNSLKKGEFGEILATLFAQHMKTRLVPIYKHSHKTSGNMAVHGMDCVALIIEQRGDDHFLNLFFYEVKTTESTQQYPSVCYQIRDSFRNVNEEIFDGEIAFIWRQLNQKGDLSDSEQLIVDLLASSSFDQTELLLCPFLVVEANNFQDTFSVPFCNESYIKPIEPLVVRVTNLNGVYTNSMS